MSFLKCKRLVEDLLLDTDIKVSGKIVKYLKDFQIHGLRFLYKNYIKETGCILNDESKLGKCFIASIFIGCLKSMNKTLIICKNKDKIGLWMFHLEILTTKQTGGLIDDCFEDGVNVGIIDISSIEAVDQNQWNYIILDERGTDLFSAKDLKLIERINCSRKLILVTKDVIENLKHFWNISQFCKREEISGMEFSDVKKEKFQNLSRDFRLRRFVKQFKNLPLTEPEVFNSLFNKWKKLNFEKIKIEIPVLRQQTVPVVVQPYSSNLFDFIESENELEISNVIPEELKSAEIFETYKKMDTELIPSDNPEVSVEESSFELFLSEDEICPSNESEESFLNQNVYMGDDELFLNEMFETNSQPQSSNKSSVGLDEFQFVESEKLSKKLLENSSEVQILDQKCSIVVVSSEEQRPIRSPDLFSDLETDDVEKAPLMYSTPINHLINSILPLTNDKTDIFEITENEIFPNVIKINSDTEMSPLRLTESDDEIKPDLSRTIDFNLLYSSVFAGKSILNETIKEPLNSCEKTPSSVEVVVMKEITSSSPKSKQTTPKGWFTKQQREDGPSTQKRRRKLELSFNKASLESCTLASQRKRIKTRSRIVLSSDDDF